MGKIFGISIPLVLSNKKCNCTSLQITKVMRNALYMRLVSMS